METSTAIILIVVALIVGYWIGWVFRGVVFLYRISKDPEGFIQLIQDVKKINTDFSRDISELESSTGIEAEALKVERHANMIYLFTLEKDEFIAQGETLKAALDEAGRRFPKRIFHGSITPEEAEALGVKVES